MAIFFIEYITSTLFYDLHEPCNVLSLLQEALHLECMQANTGNTNAAAKQGGQGFEPSLQHVCCLWRQAAAEGDVQMAQSLAVVPNMDEGRVCEAVTIGHIQVCQTLAA